MRKCQLGRRHEEMGVEVGPRESCRVRFTRRIPGLVVDVTTASLPNEQAGFALAQLTSRHK